MRLFVIVRIVFFSILLAASSILLLHSELCINYVPHKLDTFLKDCQSSVVAIAQVNGARGEEISEASSNRTARSISEGDEIVINKTEQSGMSNDDEYGLLEDIKMVEKWHQLDVQGETITLNAKTCFGFSIYDGTPYSEYDFDRPLVITLYLMVVSSIIAVMDIVVKHFIWRKSFIQVLLYTVIQVGLWASILVFMEVYRHSWVRHWMAVGQPATEIPMYPLEFEKFEIYAFILMLYSILDVLLYEHLTKRVKLVNSQGVYKCIDQENN